MKVVLSGLKEGQVVVVRGVDGGAEVDLAGVPPSYVVELRGCEAVVAVAREAEQLAQQDASGDSAAEALGGRLEGVDRRAESS